MRALLIDTTKCIGCGACAAASGVGLGFAVAYGIVQKHGGEIQVETGDLTAFHILLPLEQAPEQIPAGGRTYGRETIHSHR